MRAAARDKRVDEGAMQSLLDEHRAHVAQLNQTLDEQRQRQLRTLRERYNDREKNVTVPR